MPVYVGDFYKGLDWLPWIFHLQINTLSHFREEHTALCVCVCSLCKLCNFIGQAFPAKVENQTFLWEVPAQLPAPEDWLPKYAVVRQVEEGRESIMDPQRSSFLRLCISLSA